MSNNFYDILGVSKNASDDEIKKAYKKLAKKHHPDMGGDPKKMQEVNEAYDILGDKNKRQQYDMGGQSFGNDFGNFRTYQWNSGGNEADFEDIFNRAFGGNFGDFFHQNMNGGFSFGRGFQQSAFMKNEDVGVKYMISLEEAFFGKKESIDVNIPNEGIRTVEFTLPKGVKNGTKIRIKGKGTHKNINVPQGDLIIAIGIKPHPIFEVHDFNLSMQTTINVIDAIVGGTIKVNNIDKLEINVTIPKGIQPFQVLRVSGKGLWIDDIRRGDLMITVLINIPNFDLTKEETDLLKRLKNDRK